MCKIYDSNNANEDCGKWKYTLVSYTICEVVQYSSKVGQCTLKTYTGSPRTITKAIKRSRTNKLFVEITWESENSYYQQLTQRGN